jgi:hypothetical protein
MNQTILCCGDWGQITLSYALLPFRPSSATVSPSVLLIAPKKDGHIKLFLGRPHGRRWSCVGFRASCTGYPFQETHPAGRRLGLQRPLLAAPRAGGLGPVFALADKRKVIHGRHRPAGRLAAGVADGQA